MQKRSGRLNERQAIQTIRQRRGDVGMAGQELVSLRRAAGLMRGQILLHRLKQPRILHGWLRRIGRWSNRHGTIVLRVFHEESPIKCRKRARPRSHTFPTLSSVRSKRRATWGSVRPCK